jgi:LPS-assembly lipoprotein
MRGTIAPLALWLLSALGLSSCGFHLRGSIALPESINAVFVQSADPINPLKLEIEKLLRANRIAQIDAMTANAARVNILRDVLGREILSVNERARVSEFLLRYEAEVQVQFGSADTNVASETLSVSREYSFDERQALGAAQEEEIISAELRADMAALIVQKLQRPR